MNESPPSESKPSQDAPSEGESVENPVERFLVGFAIAGFFGFIEGLGDGFSDGVAMGVLCGLLFGSIAALAGKRGLDWVFAFLK